MNLEYNKAVADGIYLFSQSDKHRTYTVSDLDTYLLLPIKYNRIRYYYSSGTPVGLITWCWMSRDSSAKFLQDRYHPTPEDYADDTREDKELWGLEFISTDGQARRMMRLIKQELVETYGHSKVHWRRFYDRTTKRQRKF